MFLGPLSRSMPFYRGLSVLLFFLLLAGCCPPFCPPSGPTPSESSTAAILSLKKAQDIFNDAVKSDQPSVNAPGEARQKYQQVVGVAEKEVLGQADASAKVSAYALIAFAQCRLGNYTQAIKTAETGRQIYDQAKLASNRRDYGMLLMVGGLSAASQTYQDYLNLASLTKEEAQKLTANLEKSMQDINAVNNYLDRQEPITMYANLWQLALVDAAVRIWTGLPREVSKPEVCRWLDRADPVLARIPEAGNPWQNLTVAYKEKFAQKKKAECQGH